MRLLRAVTCGALLSLAACAEPDKLDDTDLTDADVTDTDTDTDTAGADTVDCDAASDGDGDGLDDCTELEELGTDPELADSDGDGDDDGAEVDCASDPLNSDEACYLCGWVRGDPGTLVSDGDDIGDTIENLTFVDQCQEEVALWDFAGEYHVLFMTAAW